MKVFAYYETAGDGWFNLHLFHTEGEAKEFWDKQKSPRKAYGTIAELEIETIKTSPTNPPVENLKCPDCGSEMVSRRGQYGVFWGCKRYPSCRGTRDNMGRSKEERRKEREESDEKESDSINGPNRFPFRR